MKKRIIATYVYRGLKMLVTLIVKSIFIMHFLLYINNLW